jgi:urocanate hydratase
MYRISWGECIHDVRNNLQSVTSQEAVIFRLHVCVLRDIFSLGFGPFRWVCTSGSPDDLQVTDQLAIRIIENILAGMSCC